MKNLLSSEKSTSDEPHEEVKDVSKSVSPPFAKKTLNSEDFVAKNLDSEFQMIGMLPPVQRSPKRSRAMSEDVTEEMFSPKKPAPVVKMFKIREEEELSNV